MKRIQAVFLSMFLLAGSAFGQAKRFHFSLFGGMTHVMAYGSNEDYVMGSNDFPSTPAHTPIVFGAAFAYSATKRLGIELRGEYILAADMSLVDPSDQDTVSVQAAKHMSFSLNLLWALTSGRFESYVIAGAGLDKISAEASSYVTKYGYEVTFTAPARTLDFFLNAGAGLHWNLSSPLGLFLEARYRMLFASPDAIQSLTGGGGIRLKF